LRYLSGQDGEEKEEHGDLKKSYKTQRAKPMMGPQPLSWPKKVGKKSNGCSKYPDDSSLS
jgi:hypothetical protein